MIVRALYLKKFRRVDHFVIFFVRDLTAWMPCATLPGKPCLHQLRFKPNFVIMLKGSYVLVILASAKEFLTMVLNLHSQPSNH